MPQLCSSSLFDCSHHVLQWLIDWHCGENTSGWPCSHCSVCGFFRVWSTFPLLGSHHHCPSPERLNLSHGNSHSDLTFNSLYYQNLRVGAGSPDPRGLVLSPACGKGPTVSVWGHEGTAWGRFSGRPQARWPSRSRLVCSGVFPLVPRGAVSLSGVADPMLPDSALSLFCPWSLDLPSRCSLHLLLLCFPCSRVAPITCPWHCSVSLPIVLA